jgi:hypothetical protein
MEGAIVNAAFGGFLAEANPPGHAHTSLAQWGKAMGVDVEYDARLLRRYDGDRTLPRGRYSTLCSNEEGDDGGTFAQEMTFYADPARSEAHVEIFDPAIPEQRERIVSLAMSPDAGERVVARFLPFAQPQDAAVPKAVVTSIPIAIDRIAVEGVLDLRRPAAARWLARTIPSLTFEAGGERLRCYPNRPDVDAFEALLPSLLDQAKGGGNFHKIVGLYLRQLGVAGLVFPSVRGDIAVEYRNGEPERARGWTFVDYREAPPLRECVFFELRPDWPAGLVVEGGDDTTPYPAKFASEVRWRVDGLEDGSGGWSVSGLSARLTAVSFVDSMRAAMRFRLPEASEIDITNLVVFVASMEARHAANVAAMILYSLLGLRQAQHDLRALVSNNAGAIPNPALWLACADPPPVDRPGVTRTPGLLERLASLF